MRDIGKNIRDLRQQSRLTQDELAERLFVTRQTISNYENGRTRPDVDQILRLAEVFGTDANAVLYGPPVLPSRKSAVACARFYGQSTSPCSHGWPIGSNAISTFYPALSWPFAGNPLCWA